MGGAKQLEGLAGLTSVSSIVESWSVQGHVGVCMFHHHHHHRVTLITLCFAAIHFR